jgi:hypothetical protein
MQAAILSTSCSQGNTPIFFSLCARAHVFFGTFGRRMGRFGNPENPAGTGTGTASLQEFLFSYTES